MTNKKIGNTFEEEFCELLSANGFWAHNFAQKSAGQPADVIAVKNKKAYLIDCKVCSTKKGFDLSRVEENQALSMDLWRECGNGYGYFAIKLEAQIYMLPYYAVTTMQFERSVMPRRDILNLGCPVDQWIERCK